MKLMTLRQLLRIIELYKHGSKHRTRKKNRKRFYKYIMKFGVRRRD